MKAASRNGRGARHDPATDESLGCTPPAAAAVPATPPGSVADGVTSGATPAPDAPAGGPGPGNALRYYEAIEHASHDMLAAARSGDWDCVVKLEGACALLISQLKHAAAQEALDARAAQLKSVIMQRILLNDAEIRHLAEPWLDDLDNLLAGRAKTLH